MCQYLQIMLNIFSLINPVYNDAPEPWQIGFQDGASPTFEGITELHNSIFFYLLLISVGVAWMLGSVVVNYNSARQHGSRTFWPRQNLLKEN